MKKIECPICSKEVSEHLVPFRQHLRLHHALPDFKSQESILEKLFPRQLAITRVNISQQKQYKEIKNKMWEGKKVTKEEFGLIQAMNRRSARLKRAYYQ